MELVSDHSPVRVPPERGCGEPSRWLTHPLRGPGSDTRCNGKAAISLGARMGRVGPPSPRPLQPFWVTGGAGR